jgi:hypothetical protein
LSNIFVAKVVENKCSHRQKARDPEEIYLDKCTVGFGQEQCSHSQIRLPKQVKGHSLALAVTTYFG